MKGVRYITDAYNRKTAVVIDLEDIETQTEEIHELIDVLVAESRKGGELIPWEKAKQELRQLGKL